MMYIELTRFNLENLYSKGLYEGRYNASSNNYKLVFTKRILEADFYAYRSCMLHPENNNLMVILQVDERYLLQHKGIWIDENHFMLDGNFIYARIDRPMGGVYYQYAALSRFAVPEITNFDTQSKDRTLAYIMWLSGFGSMVELMSKSPPNTNFEVNESYTEFHRLGQKFAIDNYDKNIQYSNTFWKWFKSDDIKNSSKIIDLYSGNYGV